MLGAPDGLRVCQGAGDVHPVWARASSPPGEQGSPSQTTAPVQWRPAPLCPQGDSPIWSLGPSQFLPAAGFEAMSPGLPGGLLLPGQPCDLLSCVPSPPCRRPLRGERALGPLRQRCVQERGHLREPAHRGLPLRVPPRRLREALLRGDHPQLPAPVLRHLPGPPAAFPLQHLPHVSVDPPPR